jgi:quercetin dioxygenase-like cupin family protein
VYTHPYDLVVIPLTASKLEVQIGPDKQVRDYAPGNALFIARNQPHAVANLGPGTFSVMGVAVK